MPEDLSVTVIETDDEENVTIEVLARCSLVPIGRGAFNEAVKLRPRSHILLKDGSRVIERHTPSPPPLRVVQPPPDHQRPDNH